MKARFKKFQERLSRWKIDALLITTPENIRFLSGFTGSSAVILITPHRAFFLTDSRYATQARDEIEGFRLKIYKKQTEGVASFIQELNLRHVGFEKKGINYDTYSRMRLLLKGRKFVPVSDEIEKIRKKKSVAEVQSIRKAARLAYAGFEAALQHIAPGVLERDVAIEVEMEMKKKGAEAISFDTIVASGPRAALPHGKASYKKLKKSELVIVDLGARYNGYYSDETCTFMLGTPDSEQKRIYQVVKDAHDFAIEAVKPGVTASHIDSVARSHIDSKGCGKYFGHGTGHGIGLAVHEWPNITPYNDEILEEGMIFTIEPGVYIPDWGGVRIEDMVLVTKDGSKVLTKMPKDMMIL